MHDRDTVAHGERLFLIVRHVEKRDVELALEALELELHQRMQFALEPRDGFSLVGTVREQVYVGSMIKAIVVLPDGQEVRLERLAGDELPENGLVYLYWDPADARTIKTLDQVFFSALENAEMR